MDGWMDGWMRWRAMHASGDDDDMDNDDDGMKCQ